MTMILVISAIEDSKARPEGGFAKYGDFLSEFGLRLPMLRMDLIILPQ